MLSQGRRRWVGALRPPGRFPCVRLLPLCRKMQSRGGPCDKMALGESFTSVLSRQPE